MIETIQSAAGRVPTLFDRPDAWAMSQDFSIEEKISALFVGRGIIAFARHLLAPREFARWISIARLLQRRIYLLDLHYEGTAALGSDEEQKLWMVLRSSGSLLEGEGVIALERAVADLREYGRYEAHLHSGIQIHQAQWPQITHLKSADISLARELAYTYAGASPSAPFRRFLRCFDQAMEIVEDLEDINEDGLDWNLNLWLTPIRQGDSVVSAAERTQASLRVIARTAQDAWDALSANEQERCRPWWSRLIDATNGALGLSGRTWQTVLSVNWRPYSALREEG